MIPQSISEITTDLNGRRYIHVCQCRHHPSCEFTRESLDPVISRCSERCSGCDSIRSRGYNPATIQDVSDLPSPFDEALQTELKEKEYLKPLREKLE